MRRNMSINIGKGARPATSGAGGSQPQRLLAAPFFTMGCKKMVRSMQAWVDMTESWRYLRRPNERHPGTAVVCQSLQRGESAKGCGGALQGVERNVQRLQQEIRLKQNKKAQMQHNSTENTNRSITCNDDEDATSSGRFDIKLLSRRKDVMLVAAKRDGSSVTSLLQCSCTSARW